MRRVLALAVLLALGAGVAVAPAHANGWGDIATISMTSVDQPNAYPNQLCFYDGSDLACPGYAPSVVSTGYVGIGTNAPVRKLEVLGAGDNNPIARFSYGSGSAGIEFKGIAASTGYLNFGEPESISNASGDNGYIRYNNSQSVYPGGPNAFVFGTSRTDRVIIDSSGNVGIGTLTPNAKLEVAGTVSATRFVGDGSGLTGVVASSGDRIVSGTTSLLAVSSSGFVSLTQAGTNTGWFDPQRGLVTLGVSATGGISGTSGYFSGNVGIGTSAPRVPLDVVGNIYASGVYTAPSSTFYIDARQGIVNIARVYTGTVFDLGGTERINFHNSSVNFINSNVGIGTTMPTTKLEVSGTVSATNLMLAAGTNGCDASNHGQMRRNSATGRMQICIVPGM
jgi:hypothetical protein